MNKLTVVMYHYVRDLINSRYSGIKGLDISAFKEQLGYLKKHYNFVTVEEVIGFHQGDFKLPPKAVLLTFDDAYIEHFNNVFPLLKKNGVQGAFYAPVKAIEDDQVLDVNKIHFILACIKNINSLLDEIKWQLSIYREEYGLKSYEAYFLKLASTNRFDTAETVFVKRLLQVELGVDVRKIIVDNLFMKFVNINEKAFSRELYMSEDQLSFMVDSGMHIGSHCYDHFWLSSLTKNDQRKQIVKSLEFLKRIGCDLNNWSICYPYGDYNEDTIELLEEYNCKLGFTTQVDVAELSNKASNIYTIPRLDTNDLPKDINASIDNWYLKG